MAGAPELQEVKKAAELRSRLRTVRYGAARAELGAVCRAPLRTLGLSFGPAVGGGPLQMFTRCQRDTVENELLEH